MVVFTAEENFGTKTERDRESKKQRHEELHDCYFFGMYTNF
jgi:hypothetical protein